jgi:hypothetical protein
MPNPRRTTGGKGAQAGPVNVDAFVEALRGEPAFLLLFGIMFLFIAALLVVRGDQTIALIALAGCVAALSTSLAAINLKYKSNRDSATDQILGTSGYDARSKALKQLIAEIRQIATGGGVHKHQMATIIQVAIYQALATATDILDREARDLSANLMLFVGSDDGAMDPEKRRMAIAYAWGRYKIYSLRREFVPLSEPMSGTCGKALREHEILVYPDLKLSGDETALEFPEEAVAGVINIPIPSLDRPGEWYGVLNIDSPVPHRFSKDKCYHRAKEIQHWVCQLLDLEARIMPGDIKSMTL